MAAALDRPRVYPGAFALGLTGLLPALAATCLVMAGRRWTAALALGYALVILSFLGGMWWGFAMRRGEGQAALAGVAVVPSLVAFAIAVAFGVGVALPWLLVAAGVAVLLTLPVDRALTLSAEAPAAWMRLRVPLSIGLGALTILSGVASGR